MSQAGPMVDFAPIVRHSPQDRYSQSSRRTVAFAIRRTNRCSRPWSRRDTGGRVSLGRLRRCGKNPMRSGCRHGIVDPRQVGEVQAALS